MRILVYGDSNSWGYLDDRSGHPSPNRWPRVMAKHLAQAGQPIELIEECLPGRTIDREDPQMGDHFNGSGPMGAILLSHQPLDLVMIMLGTNDFKKRFDKSATDIAASLIALADQAKGLGVGAGGWHGEAEAAVMIVCPPALGALADDKDFDRFDEWIGGREKSLALPKALSTQASDAGFHMVDANSAAQSSDVDPIHWTEATHIEFGSYMAARLQEYLAANT